MIKDERGASRSATRSDRRLPAISGLTKPLLWTAAALMIIIVLAACGSSGSSASSGALRVSGKHLVFGSASKVVQLRGVNRSGTEYQCVNGYGYFDSPTPKKPDSQSIVKAMKSWDIDVVRVPLNEGCWLGINAPGGYSGARYRAAIEAYVQRLTADGLFVVLSLQWSAPGSTKSNLRLPMADAQHAPTFWKSVGSTFKSNSSVMFDLYNEPFDISWACWKNGCEVPAGSGSSGATWPSYQAAGMQQLVTAVRSSGASQPLLLGGDDYALNLSGWLTHEPSDPDHALIASVHSYGGLSPCDSSCTAAIVQTSRKVPVVFGELGETDCSTDYIDQMMSFADQYNIGYLGWAWDATSPGGWSCSAGPALISSYDGMPTAYGAGFEQHFTALGVAVRP